MGTATHDLTEKKKKVLWWKKFDPGSNRASVSIHLPH